MRRVVAAAALAALAGLAPRAAAETVDLSAPAAQDWFRTDHFGVYAGDARVGWMRRSLERTTHGGVECVAGEVELHFDVAGDGNDTVTRTRTLFAAGGDQLLVHATTEQTTQARRVARTVVRNGPRFDVVTEQRGERETGATPAATITLADELAYERLAATARAAAEPVGTTITAARLEFGTAAASTRVLTVTGAADADGRRVLDVAITAGRSRESARIDAQGRLLEGSLGPQFRYRLVPESVAKDASGRTSLEAMSRVPMDARLEPAAGLRKLVVAWDQGVARAIPSTPRQRVRTEGTTVVVEVLRDADGAPADEDAMRGGLADEPGLDLSDPAVRAVATKALAGTSDRGRQVARLLESVAKGLEKTIVLGTPSVTEILRTPRGDCTEHARLFVALCRAAGIPARTVDGLSWISDEAGAFGWHTWAEVALLGKWVAVDPTTGDHPAPATRIAVEATPEIQALLWGKRFRLVAAER